jgi:hypothetical protein
MVDEQEPRCRRRLFRAGLVLGSALALTACQGVGSGIRQAATGVGLGTPTPVASDFVTQSRAADLDYRPVGVRPETGRATGPRDAEGVKALEAELDEARRRHEAIAGRPAAPAPKPAPAASR